MLYMSGTFKEITHSENSYLVSANSRQYPKNNINMFSPANESF